VSSGASGVPPVGLRVVVPDLGGRPTGGQTYNEHLVAGLRARGHEVHVDHIAGDWPAGTAAQHERLGALLVRSGTVLVDGLVAAAAPAPVRHAVAAGTRVVVLVHSPLPAEAALTDGQRRRFAALEGETLHAASGVLCTSDWAAEDLRRRYGLDRVAVARPGAERAPVARGSAPPRFLVLAALVPGKNHPLIAAALEELQDLDWTARFVGPPSPDPQYAATLERRLACSPVADRVVATGPLTGSALAAEWDAADLLLLPSRFETFGLVVTEAFAHGVPAVVGAGTAAERTLHGDGDGEGDGDGRVDRRAAASALPGAAVGTEGPGPLADVLRAWLQDQEQRERWRQAALDRRGHLRTWADAAADAARVLTAP
jgi:glycosyltransferase involved in cell wall biosynthesis